MYGRRNTRDASLKIQIHTLGMMEMQQKSAQSNSLMDTGNWSSDHISETDNQEENILPQDPNEAEWSPVTLPFDCTYTEGVKTPVFCS